MSVPPDLGPDDRCHVQVSLDGILNAKRIVSWKPLWGVRDSFHPRMAWLDGVVIIDCVADADSQGVGKIYHSLF